MLVITRRASQETYLVDSTTGDAIATIRIVSVAKDGKVRMGLEAPANVTILRDDIKKLTKTAKE